MSGCQDIERRTTIINSGGIRIIVWIKLMENCMSKLGHSYQFYKLTNNRFYSYIVKIRDFVDNSNSCNKNDIYILYDNNRLQKIDINKYIHKLKSFTTSSDNFEDNVV